MPRSRITWKHGLIAGMDQATNPSLVKDNEAQLLQNVSLDQPGSWSSRRGEERVGDLISGSDSAWGLFSYFAHSGSFKLGLVTNRDLYFLNEGTNSFGTAVDTDEWPASTRVDGINFLNRLYLGSEDGATPLKYTTGSAVTNVTPTIGGSMLAVNKDSLAVAGNSLLPNTIFYTNPFTDTFFDVQATCGANADVAGANTVTITTSSFEPGYIGSILYNTTDGSMLTITGWTSGTVVTVNGATSTWDNDTVYVLKNNFKCDGRVTGLVGFGEYFIAWDEKKMYLWDPTQQPNGWSFEHDNFGCSDYRSVQIVDGVVIWASRRKLCLYAGQGKPVDITAKIRNRVTNVGIYDLLDADNWGTMASGSRPGEGIYYLSIGNLKTLSGALASNLSNVVIVFDTKKSSGGLYIESRNQTPTVYTTFINSDGDLDLYYAGSGQPAVYKTNTGVTDKDSANANKAINFKVVTQEYQLSNPTVQTRMVAYYMRYISDCFIKIRHSVNRGSFVDVSTLDISESVKVVKILPPKGGAIDGFSHALEISSLNLGGLDSSNVTGLNDMTINTTYIGTTIKNFVVEIDGVGSPNTFRWSNDGGSTWEASTVSITGSAQTLEDGVQITFGATTGHTLNDKWTFQGGPTDIVIEAYGFETQDLGTLTIASK